MNKCIFCTAGNSAAMNTAVDILKNTYTFLPFPDQTATHLLLPVPSLKDDGSIIGGTRLEELLQSLSTNITIVGGNLRHPRLYAYQTIDLLQDPVYLAKNAAITAHCALAYGMNHLPVTLDNCPVLILGYGRISKCLAGLLKQLGADVTIAARKETDRAMAAALGFGTTKITTVEQSNYRLIYNTIPSPVLSDGNGNAIKIDLASVPGMNGDDVIIARGLPGKEAPESSGKLIADTILRLVERKDDVL